MSIAKPCQLILSAILGLGSLAAPAGEVRTSLQISAYVVSACTLHLPSTADVHVPPRLSVHPLPTVVCEQDTPHRMRKRTKSQFGSHFEPRSVASPNAPLARTHVSDYSTLVVDF